MEELLSSADYTAKIDAKKIQLDQAYTALDQWKNRKVVYNAARDRCSSMPGRYGGSSKNSKAKTLCTDTNSAKYLEAKERVNYYSLLIGNINTTITTLKGLRDQALAAEEDVREHNQDIETQQAATTAKVSLQLATKGLTKEAVLKRETLVGEGRKTATINTAKATEKQTQNLVQAQADAIAQQSETNTAVKKNRSWLIIGGGAVLVLAIAFMLYSKSKK